MACHFYLKFPNCSFYDTAVPMLITISHQTFRRQPTSVRFDPIKRICADLRCLSFHLRQSFHRRARSRHFHICLDRRRQCLLLAKQIAEQFAPTIQPRHNDPRIVCVNRVTLDRWCYGGDDHIICHILQNSEPLTHALIACGR